VKADSPAKFAVVAACASGARRPRRGRQEAEAEACPGSPEAPLP
jgi:hypothetical protein